MKILSTMRKSKIQDLCYDGHHSHLYLEAGSMLAWYARGRRRPSLIRAIAVAYDDLIDTAGSLKALVAKLFELGAEKVYAFATHGVLAGDAIQNLRDSGIDQVFITDSIRHEHGKLPAEFITVVHVGELFGEAIWRNNTQGSIHAIDGMFNLKTSKS